MANFFPTDGDNVQTVCTHPVQVLRTLEAILTCETIAEFCACCGQQLTEPKTECR